MYLEFVKKFEHRPDKGGLDRDKDQLCSRAKDASHFGKARFERYILEHAAGNDQIKSFIGERKFKDVSLDYLDPLFIGLLVPSKFAPGDIKRAVREVKGDGSAVRNPESSSPRVMIPVPLPASARATRESAQGRANEGILRPRHGNH